MLVGVLDRHGAGHKLVVQRLQAGLRVVGDLGGGALVPFQGAGGQHRPEGGHGRVDLVEGQPVFDLVLVAVKDGFAVVHKVADDLAAFPAVALFHQRVGQLIMADGHQRLDAVLFAAVEHLVVEGQARLVGLFLHAGGEDARPVDGGAEHLEPHLGKQGNVLLVMVVEVDGVVAGVELVRPDGPGDPFRLGMGAVGAVVRHALALAVHVPGALELVGGAGAAPQEIVTENAHVRLPPCLAGMPVQQPLQFVSLL